MKWLILFAKKSDASNTPVKTPRARLWVQTTTMTVESITKLVEKGSDLSPLIDAHGKEVSYFCDLCQWPPIAVGMALLVFFQTGVGQFIQEHSIRFVFTVAGIVLFVFWRKDWL